MKDMLRLIALCAGVSAVITFIALIACYSTTAGGIVFALLMTYLGVRESKYKEI